MADRKTVVQVKHRLRRDLLHRIARSAETKDRSINEEIEQRLEESFRTEELYGGPRISAVFRILANHIALAKATAGRDWAKNDQVRVGIAQVFAELLAKNLPQFYSVTIETVNQYGAKHAITEYASDEIAEREHPRLGEIRRQHRLSSSSANTERGDSK